MSSSPLLVNIFLSCFRAVPLSFTNTIFPSSVLFSFYILDTVFSLLVFILSLSPSHTHTHSHPAVCKFPVAACKGHPHNTLERQRAPGRVCVHRERTLSGKDATTWPACINTKNTSVLYRMCMFFCVWVTVCVLTFQLCCICHLYRRLCHQTSIYWRFSLLLSAFYGLVWSVCHCMMHAVDVRVWVSLHTHCTCECLYGSLCVWVRKRVRKNMSGAFTHASAACYVHPYMYLSDLEREEGVFQLVYTENHDTLMDMCSETIYCGLHKIRERSTICFHIHAINIFFCKTVTKRKDFWAAYNNRQRRFW